VSATIRKAGELIDVVYRHLVADATAVTREHDETASAGPGGLEILGDGDPGRPFEDHHHSSTATA
jgi:hypothetical protein